MLGFVGQQRLDRRQRRWRRARLAIVFFPRNADAIVERTQPGPLRDLSQPRHGLGIERFGALVAGGDKAILLVELRPAQLQLALLRGGIAAAGNRLQAFDLRIALQNLEAHANLVDAVAQRFQLGGLVHNVLGRRDLAAIVQPGGDVQRLPLLGVEIEIAERSLARIAGGAGEHLRQFGHPLAMPAGIARLGVDRAGEHCDQRTQQILLGLQQPVRFDRQRGGAGERVDQGQALGADRLAGPGQQAKQADDLFLSIDQRDGDQGGAVGVVLQRRGETLLLGGGSAHLEDHRRSPLQRLHELRVRRIDADRQRSKFRVDCRSVGTTQGGRAQRAIVFGHQVNCPGARTRDRQRFMQQMRQQSIEIPFAGQRRADVEKIRDGGLERAHRLRKLVDFAHPRAHRHRRTKVEAADGVNLVGKPAQGLRDATCQQPDQRHDQHQHGQRYQRFLAQDAFGIGQQLVARCRHRQVERLGEMAGQLGDQADPVAVADLQFDRATDLARLEASQRLLQHRHPEFVELRQTHAAILLAHGARLFAVRDHGAARAEQRQFRRGRDALARQRLGKLAQYEVRADHRAAVCGPAGERGTDFASREEHIGLGLELVRRNCGGGIPAARARIEPVVGTHLASQRLQLAIEKQVNAARLAIGRSLDRLHQKPRRRRRADPIAPGWIAQRPDQEKVPACIADVERRDLRVLLQCLAQPGEAAQSLFEVSGVHQWFIG